MFIVAMIIIVVAVAVAVMATMFFVEDAAALGIAMTIIAIVVLLSGIALLNLIVKENTTLQVKTEVLKHLTYTESVTLTPKDNEFFYQLNDSTMTDLYKYLTLDPYKQKKD